MVKLYLVKDNIRYYFKLYMLYRVSIFGSEQLLEEKLYKYIVSYTPLEKNITFISLKQ